MSSSQVEITEGEVGPVEQNGRGTGWTAQRAECLRKAMCMKLIHHKIGVIIQWKKGFSID